MVLFSCGVHRNPSELPMPKGYGLLASLKQKLAYPLVLNKYWLLLSKGQFQTSF